MKNLIEQPVPVSAEKKAGLEAKISEYRAELATVEAGLKDLEPVLKVKAGLASAGVVFERLRVPENRAATLGEARTKLGELGVLLETLLGDDYESLLGRRRELRQLIVQAEADGGLDAESQA